MEPPADAPDGREERLRRLLDVGRALVSERDTESVLERVVDAARALTGARYAALGVLDERRESLERFITSGIDEAARREIGNLPRGRGVLGVLITDPHPLRLDDVGSHPRSYGFPPGHPPMRSFLGVPVRIHEHVYGNLYLTEKETGTFDADDEETLELLAQWVAIAIENARAYTHTEQRRDELEQAVARFEATTEIADALAGETDLELVLELVAKRARALTEARSMTVMLHDRDALVVAAVAGELDTALRGARIPVDGSVSGLVLRSGQPERLADAPSRLRFQLAKETNAQTGLFVPLRMRGRVLGVLAGFDRLRDGPEFSARDEQLLSAFAVTAAAAVATAQDVATQTLRRSMVAAEEERSRWARELHDETLQELAALKLLLATARISEDGREREDLLRLAVDRIDHAVVGLRRLITDLRPAVLDEHGIGPALEALVDRVRTTSEFAIDLHVDLGESERLRPELEDTVYRVTQEALTNVVKHAGASRAAVEVAVADDVVTVVVRDDGRGFDAGADTNGFGMLGMRERVKLAGGTIEVESSADGTEVRVALPLAGEARASWLASG